MRNLLVIFGALVLLAGCGSQPPAPAPAAPAASASPRGVPVGPAGRTYLEALRSIDPGLVENRARAILRGRDVCDDLAQGKDRATVVKNAALRFAGGHASIDQAKAEKIVAAIGSSGLCKEAGHA
ncbi:DUF732 domain-containing protein [Amycolatopsis sp. NPDC023774]|uniref:DUF732 domain-containing protein n=1 Tax=Amycolatopsis sp. NPDC023774 TaxID=3155015 RepID=UPI0033F9ADF3